MTVTEMYKYNGYITRNGHSPNGHKCPFGCNGYVTVVAVGKRQRLYSGVRMFTWFYLNSINISGFYKGVDLDFEL